MPSQDAATPSQIEVVDTSTCEERLELLAQQPEYDAIRGELLHSAAELRGRMELLHHLVEAPVSAAMIEAGYAYMVDHGAGHVKRWKPIDRDDLASLFTAMWSAR